MLATFLLALFLLAPATLPATQPRELTVITFNIRNSHAPDLQDRWQVRREGFAASVKRHQPDVIGLQEVQPDQFDDLKNSFADYTSLGIGRDVGGRGEACQILLRTSRFDVLESKTFWLSPEPDTIASVGWDAQLTRICTWARIRDKTLGREMLIANTHFDHIGQLAREESAKLLARKLPELAGDLPIILMGDLNANPQSTAYAALFSNPLIRPQKFTDAFRLAHPEPGENEGTFHAFKGNTNGDRIDYIAPSRQWKVIACEIDHAQLLSGRYPSDHFAVIARLTLE